MSRRYSKSGLPCKRKEEAATLAVSLERPAILEMIRDELHQFATEMGLVVARELLEDEVTQRCGKRYQRDPQRQLVRYGHQRGVATLAGQKLPLARPRVRYRNGAGEAELEAYRLLQRQDAMPRAALQRMLCGVSCRDYEEVVERAREGFGITKSSVSRSFVRATAGQVQRLAERRFDGVRFAVIFIDGIEYAGETMVVALGVTEGGEKRVLGLRQGATENARVCTSLLEELRERGLAASQPTLFVLDGAKALRAAVKQVWGRLALIQRCQQHKKENVRAHLSSRHWPEAQRRLNEAYGEADYSRAQKLLKDTAAWLARISPDAAASLHEGMEETLTVTRLGLSGPLRQSLATTNLIESALSIARTITARVKRWRDGDMRQRWCAAGLLRAETRFRRLKGYRQLPHLLAALEALVNQKSLDAHPEVA